MGDTLKMPGGGYDVKVVRKEDILKCIDSNILDKDLMLAFINQFEIDATNFLSQGRWTNLLYIGTLRKNQYKEAMNSQEIKELDEAARENLDKNKYILFRKNLRDDIAKAIKRERVYKYTLSQVVKKNKNFYKYLETTRSELIARVVCFSMFDLRTKRIYEL
jgi:hypothetical protein